MRSVSLAYHTHAQALAHAQALLGIPCAVVGPQKPVFVSSPHPYPRTPQCRSVKALFVRTKRLVVDVIRFQQGKSLKMILETPASPEDEAAHMERALEVKAKNAEMEAEVKAEMADGNETPSPSKSLKSGGSRSSLKRESVTDAQGQVLTLAEIKERILTNAAVLESHGLCSAEDNYQGLLNAVAQDIRNQRIYRRQRKAELAKLTATLAALAEKKTQMNEQIEQYGMCVIKLLPYSEQPRNFAGSELRCLAGVGAVVLTCSARQVRGIVHAGDH